MYINSFVNRILAPEKKNRTPSYLCESDPGPQALLVRSDHHLHIQVYNTLNFATFVDKVLQFDDRPEHDLA